MKWDFSESQAEYHSDITNISFKKVNAYLLTKSSLHNLLISEHVYPKSEIFLWKRNSSQNAVCQSEFQQETDGTLKLSSKEC